MIEEVYGNLLESDVDALVNTVNTVGVMGKGIALQFKRAYPENYRRYVAACKKGEVRLGEMFIHETEAIGGPRYIVNFPTKKHWKSRSMLADIESGLDSLRQEISNLGIKSIAVPPLGCGNGGLDWAEVRPLIVDALGKLGDVEILVYPPAGAPEPSKMPVRTKRPSMTRARAALLLAFERYHNQSVWSGQSDEDGFSIVEAQKVAYFLQFSGWSTTWAFSPSYFGPYARTIDQFISSVEGHFISGYGDGTAGSKASLVLDPAALDEASSLLGEDKEFQAILDKLGSVLAGFEFPYGVELLATVHYVVAQCDSPPSVDQVVETINAWSTRKGHLFKKPQAESAYRHLAQTRLVGEPA